MLEIRRIIAFYDQLDLESESVALATVVHVEESSYRRIGARMLVSSSGHWTGGISGGCLEGDALQKAQRAIFNKTASVVTYDTMDDDANEIGVGLGCNGKIQVLFVPIDHESDQNPIEKLRQLLYLKKPSILFTIISSGSSPELLGNQMTQSNLEGGLDFLDLGHNQLIHISSAVFERKKSDVTYIQSDQHGKLKMLIEFVRPETQLVIVGDNYDVDAMVNIAKALGWNIKVVGKLSKIGKSVLNKIDNHISLDQLDELICHEYTAVILMSHDYKIDKHMLAHFIEKAPTYLGILGPKKRFEKMRHELPNIEFDSLDFIYSPTGLELGAESPEEIALSVAAEIVAVFRDHHGGHLREKAGSIHPRD